MTGSVGLGGPLLVGGLGPGPHGPLKSGPGSNSTWASEIKAYNLS